MIEFVHVKIGIDLKTFQKDTEIPTLILQIH